MGELGPDYSPQLCAALDALANGTGEELLNAVCDVIDLICGKPGDRRARAGQLRRASGMPAGVEGSHQDWG